MYQWVVVLHLVGVLGFLLARSGSILMTFKLRKKRNPERVRALLDLSQGSLMVMYPFLLLLLAAGIVAGFMGHWWGEAWIWVSLGVLVAMAAAFGLLGTPYYDRVRSGVGLPPFQGERKGSSTQPLASGEELDALLTSARPFLLTAIGAAGLLIILWLMMFKPF